MKKTIYQIDENKEIQVLHAAAISSGFGHKSITVELLNISNGERKTFKEVTNNMPAFDAASELEGQEKYEALYEIIANKIDFALFNWFSEQE